MLTPTRTSKNGKHGSFFETFRTPLGNGTLGMSKNVVIGQNMYCCWSLAEDNQKKAFGAMYCQQISLVSVGHRRLVSFVSHSLLRRNNLGFLCHTRPPFTLYIALFHIALSLLSPPPPVSPAHYLVALSFSIPHVSLSTPLVPGTHPSLLGELGQPRHVEPRLDRCNGIALGQHHVALPRSTVATRW